MSYNLHGILHFAEDAKRFGPLTSVSSFPFESFNASFKNFIRARKHPLQEYMNRFYEKCNVSFFCDPVERKKSKSFILGEYLVVPINYADFQNPDLLHIDCRVYQNTTAIFEEPCDSRLFKLLKCRCNENLIQPVEKNLLKVTMLFSPDNLI